MAATAQAQAEATKAAQRAGIEHAKAKGDSYRGRKPSYTHEQLATEHAVVEHGGDTMLPRIGIMRALYPDETAPRRRKTSARKIGSSDETVYN